MPVDLVQPLTLLVLAALTGWGLHRATRRGALSRRACPVPRPVRPVRNRRG